MANRIILTFAIFASALLGACASPNAPQPPADKVVEVPAPQGSGRFIPGEAIQTGAICGSVELTRIVLGLGPDVEKYRAFMMHPRTECIDSRLFDRPPFVATTVAYVETFRGFGYTIEIWEVAPAEFVNNVYTWVVIERPAPEPAGLRA